MNCSERNLRTIKMGDKKSSFPPESYSSSYNLRDEIKQVSFNLTTTTISYYFNLFIITIGMVVMTTLHRLCLTLYLKWKA